MAQTQTPEPKPPVAPAPQIEPVAKSSAKKIVIILLVIVLVLGGLSTVGGFLIYRAVKNAADKTGVEDVIRDLEEYPSAYEAAGLPKYPGGRVANLSGRGGSVEDGVSIIVTTSDSSDKVAEYYDRELKANGWEVQEGALPAGQIFVFRTYEKDGQEFALTVTTSTENNETSATISWDTATTAD